MDRIWRARSAGYEIVARVVNELPNCSVSRRNVRYQHALVILRTALHHRRHECNAEASAPIPAKIGQARSLVVLVPGQIGVCELAHRNKHEGVAETLKNTREREMEIVSLDGEPA